MSSWSDQQSDCNSKDVIADQLKFTLSYRLAQSWCFNLTGAIRSVIGVPYFCIKTCCLARGFIITDSPVHLHEYQEYLFACIFYNRPKMGISCSLLIVLFIFMNIKSTYSHASFTIGLMWEYDFVFRQDFRHEVNLLVKLRHPNIVQFLGAVTQRKPLMLITEYLRGVGESFPIFRICLLLWHIKSWLRFRETCTNTWRRKAHSVRILLLTLLLIWPGTILSPFLPK